MFAPARASAHPHLVRSSPAAGAHLTSSPSEIRLVFSEAPMMAATHFFLLSSRNDTIHVDSLRHDPTDSHVVFASIRSALEPDSYTVRWYTVAADGHGANGRIMFTVAGTRSVAPVASAHTAAPVDSDTVEPPGRDKKFAESAVQVALGTPMWFARWLAFISLFILIGAASFKHLILDRTFRRSSDSDVFYQIAATGAATAGLFAAIVLIIASVIKLYGETEVMHGVSLGSILTATSWGHAWLVQLIAGVLSLGAFAAAHRRNNSAWLIAAICALVLAATPALTGHAISSDEAVFAVPVDIAHVLAGSVWLGTLSLILMVGVGSAAKSPDTSSIGARLADMVNAFSPIALLCGALVVATGAATGLMHVQPLSQLWKSTYGMALIVKLALVSLLFTLGAWNWRRVKPNLGGDEGVRALRFSAKLELTASVLVLAVTAFLVALPLPE